HLPEERRAIHFAPVKMRVPFKLRIIEASSTFDAGLPKNSLTAEANRCHSALGREMHGTITSHSTKIRILIELYAAEVHLTTKASLLESHGSKEANRLLIPRSKESCAADFNTAELGLASELRPVESGESVDAGVVKFCGP